MTDTRSRHVPCDGPVAGMDVCADDNAAWPCDAAIEADRADKAEAGWAAETMRANDAEAALAELQRRTERPMSSLARLTDIAVKNANERDAARADAKALAEALDRATRGHYEEAHDDPSHPGEFVYAGVCEECGATWPCETYGLRAALAAHKEATE
jgi:hypothetical protein